LGPDSASVQGAGGSILLMTFDPPPNLTPGGKHSAFLHYSQFRNGSHIDPQGVPGGGVLFVATPDPVI
jgi:hypothetical protein